MAQNIKRIQKELKEMRENPPTYCSCGPTGDNMYQWAAIIVGPEGSAYDKGYFKLQIEFPTEYPFKAPKLQFVTKIFHPNIDDNGNIQLEILKSSWTPVLTIGQVLTAICNLLIEPSQKYVVNEEAQKLFGEDYEQFVQKTKELVDEYAQK